MRERRKKKGRRDGGREKKRDEGVRMEKGKRKDKIRRTGRDEGERENGVKGEGRGEGKLGRENREDEESGGEREDSVYTTL